MDFSDHFSSWCDVTDISLAGFPNLNDDDVAYWSRFKRWSLIHAIFLSMGLRPRRSDDTVHDDHKGKELGSELISRIKAAKEALNVTLIPEISPDLHSLDYVNPEVDTKSFIIWARSTYSENYDPIFEKALGAYKSTAHSVSGAKKGKKAEEVKEQITSWAMEELKAGCKCNSPDLARFLIKQKKYALPGIKNEDRYMAHFKEAINIAFKEMHVPLRNQPKADNPRGKKFCKRLGHAT